jgi:hypothetical protein
VIGPRKGDFEEGNTTKSYKSRGISGKMLAIKRQGRRQKSMDLLGNVK